MPSIYIFAGGGTGGHLYPGLAVAGELMALEPSAAIVFACSNREIDRRILDSLPYGIVPQAVRPLPRGPREIVGFLKAWFASARQAKDMIADLKPAAVLGLGGFAAGPVVREAARRGVPSAMLNPDAVPGKANKMLSKLADVIFTQFESTTACFAPSARAKVRAAGCPIRRSLLAAGKADAMRHFGLDAVRRTLLVFGASLGASSINDALATMVGRLDEFAETWQILHVTGAGKGQGLADAYKAGRVPAKCLDYCDRMDLAYAAADLAVCRGGASTVAELTATGTPAVILPYPYHKDQQQLLNSRPLESAGAAVICPDAAGDRVAAQVCSAPVRASGAPCLAATQRGALGPSAGAVEPLSLEGRGRPAGAGEGVPAAVNADRLFAILPPLMRAPARLAAMRSAAQAIGKPDAALDVAKWLVQR